jgi:hypothetical protein
VSVLYPPESEYAKEARKWEAYPSAYGPPGRPFVHRDYPAMMYKAIESNPWRFEHQEAADVNERRNLESRGFVAGGPKAAADAYEKEQLEIAKLAANRAWEERRMSPEAQAEAAAYEAEQDGHVPVIPEKRRPGRPRKDESKE